MGQVQTLKGREAAARRASLKSEALLDRWVARLELGQAGEGAGAPREGESADPAPRSKATSEAERPRSSESSGQAATCDSVQTALARVTLRGSTVNFDDEAGGAIVLGQSPSHVVHSGTIAVRGPYGLTREMLHEHGLTRAQASAMEYVASWFGGPFDALAIERERGADSVRWGFWPLGTKDTCRALALWKDRAPASFQSTLEVYGIDVVSTRDDLRGPTWVVVDPARGAILRDERALDAIARDPKRLALLARAGRQDDAKMAQVEIVMRGSVLPLLQTKVARGEERRPVADVVVGARAIAGLLLALRAMDLSGMTELLASIPADGGKALDEAAWLDSIATLLRHNSQGVVGHAIRRALSSPELPM